MTTRPTSDAAQPRNRALGRIFKWLPRLRRRTRFVLIDLNEKRVRLNASTSVVRRKSRPRRAVRPRVASDGQVISMWCQLTFVTKELRCGESTVRPVGDGWTSFCVLRSMRRSMRCSARSIPLGRRDQPSQSSGPSTSTRPCLSHQTKKAAAPAARTPRIVRIGATKAEPLAEGVAEEAMLGRLQLWASPYRLRCPRLPGQD